MKTFTFILTFAVGFSFGAISFILNQENQKQTNLPKVVIPEEYMLMSYDTPIIGYYDKNHTLHIEYDNSIIFKWEGLERDIPKDGEYIQITGTNENTIYLNPIDN